jgi:hypothetical protein
VPAACLETRQQKASLSQKLGSGSKSITTLGYARVVGRRRDQAKLENPIVSLPAEYTKKPLLRGQER